MRPIYKALALCVAALGVLAFAVPAVAGAQQSAAHWEIDGNRIPNGEANAVDIETAGTLTLTAAGESITCDVTDEGRIWNDPNDPDNEGTSAYNEVEEFDIVTPCDTTIDRDCDVDMATTDVDPDWPTYGFIDAARGEVVRIDGISFTNHLEDVPACDLFADATIMASGSLTPEFNDTTDCFEFDTAAGTLTTNVGQATVSGTDCATPATGTNIGLESGS